MRRLVSLSAAFRRLAGASSAVGSSIAQSATTDDKATSITSAPLICNARTYAHTTCPLHARRMRGARRPRHREPTEGDWTCQCGELNYRSKRECFKCGAPAPPLPPGVRRPSLPGEDPHDWACPCGQMNFRGSVVCHKCTQPKPVPPLEPGKEVTLWTCPKCKGINRNSRKYCFKCGAPSPLVQFKPIE